MEREFKAKISRHAQEGLSGLDTFARDCKQAGGEEEVSRMPHSSEPEKSLILLGLFDVCFSELIFCFFCKSGPKWVDFQMNGSKKYSQISICSF